MMSCEQILANLSLIIEEGKKNDIVSTIFGISYKAIKNNEVILEENPDINKDANEKMETSTFGLFFRKDKTGYISLSFGQKYLSSYSEKSTPHYVMLIHELKHIYDYLNNKETFFNSTMRERLFFEIEAKKIEYEFISNYLIGKYQLTKLEDYIIKSYENDNLEAYNIINHKDSSAVYLFLLGMETDYKNGKITETQIIDDIIKKADKLLEKSNTFLSLITVYRNNENNFKYFANFIRLKTFIKYFEIIIAPILAGEISVELTKRLTKIMYLVNEHDEANHLYSLSLENFFEDAILT